MSLIGRQSLRSALKDTRRRFGTWALGVVGPAVALGVIGAFWHGRFGVESVSGTIVFVFAVIVAAYLVFLALATGRLQSDRDRWRRDYDVVAYRDERRERAPALRRQRRFGDQAIQVSLAGTDPRSRGDRGRRVADPLGAS